MAIENPDIDTLISNCANDKYLLCSMTSKRARDINDMMRGQHKRAAELKSVSEIAQLADCKPLSLAMEEIARGEVSFDSSTFN